jgi:methylisocitrate lyase
MRATGGLEATISRAQLLVDAGADAIFPEALRNLSEFDKVRSAIDVPMLANMTEFGKSELFTVEQLRDVGANIVIWPVSLLRRAMGAAERALTTLTDEGNLESRLGEMQHRQDPYDLVDYEDYNKFDSSVFNFHIEHLTSGIGSQSEIRKPRTADSFDPDVPSSS